MKSNETIIEALESVLDEKNLTKKQEGSIQNAIEKINSLQDEVDSAWALMDELKKSDIKNYKSMLEAKIAEKLLNAMSFMKKGKDYGTN